MNRKLTVGAATAVFFGVVLAASAAEDFYPGAEKTNQWFSAGVNAMSDGAITTNPPWKAPSDGDADVISHTIKFDAEIDDPLVYTPVDGSDEKASGEIALVNVKLVVDPNATTPDSSGLANAQAALSVVTNATNGNLEWIGIVSGGWVTLYGDSPSIADMYDIQIAVNNFTNSSSATKRIRYAVKGPGATGYTVLTNSVGVSWFVNPKQNKDSVSQIAFAGSGTVGDFSGVSILNDGATITTMGGDAGFDFTNGTVTAVVTIPSDNATVSTRTATLTVVNFENGTTTPYVQTVTSGDTLTWDLSDLTPGGTYSYTLTVKSDGVVREVKSGTFTAGNWSDVGSWFGVKVVGDNQAVTNNGVWAGAEFDVNQWNVESEATFTVADISDGSNAVSRVDTVYSFESFVDAASLEALEDGAIGGIVAVSDDGGAWCAYTGVANPESGWQKLAGSVVPEANREYVIRAEFDFLSETHRVRYMVSSDGGVSFVPLALNGNEWIDLAASVGSLSSIGMSGRGYVKSINANVADKAVAQSDGVKYNTLWEALLNGNGTVTLLTSATVAPAEISGGKFGPYTIIVNGHEFVFDKSQLTGNWKFFEKDGKWYLMKPGATYIFF